jgi:hypothetical protein
MSGPNDVDRLLRDWDSVASTAKPPARDPRQSVQSAGAFPASMLLVAAIAVAVIAIVGRGAPGPTVGVSPDASAIAIGSPEPGPSSAVGGGPVTDTDEDGRFRLELSADRATYGEGDVIAAGATVTFLGPEAEAIGSHPMTPIVFTVTEVGGEGRSTGIGPMRMPCLSTTYPRDEPVAYPWDKGGSWSDAPDPFREFYRSGPDLRLPVGEWTLTSHWGVTEDGCSEDEGSSHALTAEVVVNVVAGASPAVSPSPATWSPLAPSPTPGDPALVDRGVFDDGRFRIELTASGTVFEEGETIRAGAEVTFLGPEGSQRVGHGSPPVTFAVEEIGGERRTAAGGYDAMCRRSTFDRDEAVAYPWQRGGSWSTDNPSLNDEFAKAYVEGWAGAREGELRLPAGTWRLSAELDVNDGDCGPQNPRTASIVIRVDPAPGTAAPAPEQPVVEVGPVVICDRVSPEDCEHAVAMVREQFDAGRDLYAGADFVLVADTCPPDAECDREYPFEVTVAYAVWVHQPNGEDPAGLLWFTDSASMVQGMDGPERALVGEGDVPPWMKALVAEAADQLVPVPVFPPQLPDDPSIECPAALITGTLQEMETYGMGLEIDGETWPVRWPFGFSARRDDGQLVLLDPAGEVVGGHGDPVQAGGGLGETFVAACGAVIRAPAPQTP